MLNSSTSRALLFVSMGAAMIVGCANGTTFNDDTTSGDGATDIVVNDAADVTHADAVDHAVDVPHDTGTDTGAQDVVEAATDTGTDAADAHDASPIDTGIDVVDVTVDVPVDVPIDVPPEIGCPDGSLPDAGPDASPGFDCVHAIPINADISCPQTFMVDSCTASVRSVQCGAGQNVIFALSSTSVTRLYQITVPTGFTISSVFPPPICGTPGSCFGMFVNSGVAPGTTYYFAVMRTGGTCGPFTLTFTPM
jgi:hypothetical protein